VAIDLVRFFCLALVVVGHCMMVSPVLHADGTVTTENTLGDQPWFVPVIWIFMVMPLFFVTGGTTGLQSWQRMKARGGTGFEFAQARLLRLVRGAMEYTDRFLMGVDLRKDVKRIEAAYNDSQGVTAEFNRNVLRVLNHDLAAIARRDALTELGNRRALQEDLELLEARVSRYGHRYCMALLDVDHFKSYNYTYGHQAGDDVLQAVAVQLKAGARSGDALYRYGGEEFLCIFPEQSMATGTQAVERMRVGVEALAVPHLANPRGVLTVSAGLAMLHPDHARSAKDVLKEADEALYRAKQLGRNRVERVEHVDQAESVGQVELVAQTDPVGLGQTAVLPSLA